ncbi:MAG: transglutaminase-like domain-containing protein [Rhodoglobus sp.]
MSAVDADLDATRKHGAPVRVGENRTAALPRNRARLAPVFVIVNTTMLWLATIIATSALWPIYRDSALVVLVAVALVVGSAVAIAGAILRWGSPVVMLATIIAFLVVGVPVAVPTKAQYGVFPTFEGLLDLVTGVALSWKQLLTISLPVADYQALLVPALVLVLVTVVVGLTIALRARRGEPAVLAPIALFILATAFGPNFPSRPLDAPIALLVVVLLWITWLRWYRRRAAIRLLLNQSAAATGAAVVSPRGEPGLPGVRTTLATLLILAIASAGAVAIVGWLPPTADRTVLRTAIQPPFDPRNYVSPLSGFRKYFTEPTVSSVLFRVTGLPKDGRIRIATMDTYDGVVYAVGSSALTSESGSFTRVPSAYDQSGVKGDHVTLGVTIHDYSSVWLPTAGKFESVDFSGTRAGALRDAFYYNDVSGTAAVIGGVESGDSYTLKAVLPDQPTTSEISTLQPGSATVPKAKSVPDALTAKLEEYVGKVQGAGPRLAAMLSGLAAEGYISHGIGADEPASRSGHAADRISELMTAPRMVGDAEQYAVAAALMADDIGFPTRVVFGFVPSGGTVTGADVSAWIEVNTAQYGWVTIDPTPPFREIPPEQPEDNTQVTRPQTIVPPPVTQSETFDRPSTPDTQQDLPPDLDQVLQFVLGLLRVGAWVLVGVAIVLAPFIVVIAAKLRRRRLRRSAPNIVDRISGGWQEFEDSVIDHGISPAASATRSEVASIAGGQQSQVLAAVADRAVFSPGEPDAADADSVWRAVDELEASLDEGLTRWQRIAVRISLRSLGGYSVRTLFRDKRNAP